MYVLLPTASVLFYQVPQGTSTHEMIPAGMTDVFVKYELVEHVQP